MEHTNYCRHLVKQLSSIIEIPNTTSEMRTRAVHHMDLAQASQKFMLPPGGFLIDDSELKALDGNDLLRLPHGFIALEYQPVNKIGKIIVFVREHLESASLAVTPVYFANENGHWVSFATCFLPMVPEAAIQERSSKVAKLNFAYPEASKDAGSPEMYLSVISIVLGFLNALQCSNVKIERSETKKSKKVKASLPFDTYHILTIDTGRSGNGQGSGCGGDHRSPREHLRRGHIRRLESGRKVWVNATVVAANKGSGVIKKDYLVK